MQDRWPIRVTLTIWRRGHRSSTHTSRARATLKKHQLAEEHGPGAETSTSTRKHRQAEERDHGAGISAATRNSGRRKDGSKRTYPVQCNPGGKEKTGERFTPIRPGR